MSTQIARFPEIWSVQPADKAGFQRASRAVQAGHALRLAPGIYTGNTVDPPEVTFRRHFVSLVGQLYPDIVLSHATAFEGGAIKEGHAFGTYRYTRNIELHGVTLHLLKGPGPRLNETPTDTPLPNNAFLSSEPRFLLENLQPARRGRDGAVKAVSQEAIEKRLLRILDIRGEDSLNQLRDDAGVLAAAFGWQQPYRRLNDLIGTLLGTRSARLTTAPAKARSHGIPYDADRLTMFNDLATVLRREPLPRLIAHTNSNDAVRHAAFAEAYFSNFIEGTEFPVEEAKAFVLEGLPPAARPQDAHDIIGTYQQIINASRAARAPDADAFIALIKQRHSVLMSARPDKRPGEFKTMANRAGNTYFVEPGLVDGTLRKGFELLATLPEPFARAAYVMFLISEIHPFDDGNGRTARLFMNAEMSAADLTRIIVPTVYRDDYLSGLRAASRQADYAAYLRMLMRAYTFSSRLDYSGYDGLIAQLGQANAFSEPEEARLIMPA